MIERIAEISLTVLALFAYIVFLHSLGYSLDYILFHPFQDAVVIPIKIIKFFFH